MNKSYLTSKINSYKSVPINVIEKAFSNLAYNNTMQAEEIIKTEYPFTPFEKHSRNYSTKEKFQQFKKDGFIDRYSGERLVNPGVLKILSLFFPESFPYQKHWKMSECHIAYWELCPTIDHIYPISLGGTDTEENWATTSMMNNSIKSNWTLQQLRWILVDSGDFNEWDGLTYMFINFVEKNPKLLNDSYIKNWYEASKCIL